MRVGRWVLASGVWISCAAALSVLSLDGTTAARDALLRATRGDPGASPSASPAPSAGTPQTLRTAGGNVVAGCLSGQVRVQYLSPAAGFRIENADRAPGPQSRVTFKTDGREVRVVVRCEGDVPRADVAPG
jgi:hypothetical protein